MLDSAIQHLWKLVAERLYHIVPWLPLRRVLFGTRQAFIAAVEQSVRRLEQQDHGCANHDTEGKRFKSPIHCCDVTKPPYLFTGELCTSSLHFELLFVYIVCCRHTGQCFSVPRTCKSDVILTQWTAVVGEVTSPSSDTMCHSCAPVNKTLWMASLVSMMCGGGLFMLEEIRPYF